ncbi:hypothetical protein BB560_004082 [Smittium megazygosporum]|uniref:Anaphase-promoting complex subunit 4-like WD40 domain-containing protein n=1 Tax=Smittium megazygosporum TaxID=133381 RepID=A0A2T9ZAA2_9FUNG|nr:hypothetical protein BB560_004082 [Smittium megazygosporum]
MFSNHREIELKVLSSKIYTIAWSNSGTMLAAGDYEGKVRIWKPESTKESFELVKNNSHVTKLCWSPTNEEHLAVATFDKILNIFNVSKKAPVNVFHTFGGNINMSWSPDGKYLAVGNRDDCLTIYNLQTGATLSHTKFNFEINEMCWDNSVSEFFLATGKGPILVFKFPEMTQLRELSGHITNCYSIDMDPSVS